MSSTSFFLLFALMIGVGGVSSWARFSLLSLKPSQRKALLARGREQDRPDSPMKEAEGLLLSALIASSLAKVATPLILYAWLIRIAPEMAVAWKVAISLLVSGVCVLLFSEGLPRFLASPHRVANPRLAILALSLLNLVVFPVRLAFQRVWLLLGKLLGRHGGSFAPWLKRTPGEAVLDAEGRDTQLQEDERVLISSIFQMTDTIVREVMVPRMDMHCLEKDNTLGEVREPILQTGHSRFPVYAGNIDNIVGLFLAKDLLRYSSREELGSTKVSDVMHPIAFVPESKNISDLLREFQQARQHMAVVVDEYGSTAGLVTIEDLLEEIVGEIEDEFDHEQKLFVETKDGGYIVDAKMSISDVAGETGIKLPENSEYDTIGGFVVTMLGKVPEQGESFQSNGVLVSVLEADDRRVHRVKLLPMAEKEKRPQEKEGGTQ